ncbi:MAG: hypothetical protein LBR80_04065 [Deltaproteobacteria bacterium]|jgi:hypothetical protein|nr:hypothetical protein [Deltaproteobacteria bacterium]
MSLVGGLPTLRPESASTAVTPYPAVLAVAGTDIRSLANLLTISANAAVRAPTAADSVIPFGVFPSNPEVVAGHLTAVSGHAVAALPAANPRAIRNLTLLPVSGSFVAGHEAAVTWPVEAGPSPIAFGPVMARTVPTVSGPVLVRPLPAVYVPVVAGTPPVVSLPVLARPLPTVYVPVVAGTPPAVSGTNVTGHVIPATSTFVP